MRVMMVVVAIETHSGDADLLQIRSLDARCDFINLDLDICDVSCTSSLCVSPSYQALTITHRRIGAIKMHSAVQTVARSRES